MLYNVYAIVKYTILCTGETKICKLTKHLPIQGGLLDFQDSGRGFYKGRAQIQRGGGCVKTPVGAMSTYSPVN